MTRWSGCRLHAITAYIMAIIIGFTIFFGASRGSRSKAVAVLFLVGMMFAFPAWTLCRARLIPGQAVQPRYLCPSSRC